MNNCVSYSLRRQLLLTCHYYCHIPLLLMLSPLLLHTSTITTAIATTATTVVSHASTSADTTADCFYWISHCLDCAAYVIPAYRAVSVQQNMLVAAVCTECHMPARID
eukprot:17024-Heterococcus_DN1.PRE.4